MNANQNNTRKIALVVALVAVLLCTVIAGILLLLNNHETRLVDVETKVAELQQLIEDSQTLTDEEKTLANEDAELASDIAADDEDNYDEIIAIIDELEARIEAVEKARVSGNTSVVFDDSDIWTSIKALQKEDEKLWKAIEELRELIKANAGNSNSGVDYSSVISDLQKQIDELKNNKPAATKDYQSEIDSLLSKIANLEAQIAELQKNGNSNGNVGGNANNTVSEPENTQQGSQGGPADNGNTGSNVPSEPENTQQGGQGGPADNGNTGSNVPSEPTNCYQGGNVNSNGNNNGYNEPEGFENGNTEGQVIDLRTGSQNTNNSNDAVEVGEPDIVIGEPTDVFQG